MERDKLRARIAGIVDYLRQAQGSDGEFRMLRTFRTEVGCYVQATELPGWYSFGKCPFAAANIVLALHEVGGAAVAEIKAKALAFIISGLEHGFARYVPRIYQPVSFPADVDDTALALAAAEWSGAPVPDRRGPVAANMTAAGTFRTWFLPRPRQALHPSTFPWMARDAWRWMTAMRRWGEPRMKEMVREYRTAAEPAVAANVLLYLGDRRRAVDALIAAVDSGEIVRGYYDDVLFTHFHVARTAYYKVPRLRVLRQKIVASVASTPMHDQLRAAATALTLCYLGEPERARGAIEVLLDSGDDWQPIHYCNDLDGVYRDGSAELTAAFALEAIDRYQKSV